MNAATNSLCYRVALASAVALAASVPSVLANPARQWAISTYWMLLELLIAISVSYFLGMIAATPHRIGLDKWLDRAISRGLELVAALPLVLTSALVVVLAATPVALAVALVIGSLGGLRCARIIIGSTGRQRDSNDATQRVPGDRRALARRISVASLPALFDQLIGLEAAFTWLGLYHGARTGGWGASLGHSAGRGDLSQLAVWSLASVGFSVGLRLLIGLRPGSQRDDVRSTIQSAPPLS